MSDAELGMKAKGVCVDPLLHYGIPADQTVDSIIQDIDTQLSENQSRLEECVLELMELSQNLSGVAEKFTHPSEALAHIAENRLLDKQMCFDPDSEAIARLLRNVLQLMERNPGCEEKVLHQLFEVCCAEGVALPYRPSGDNPISQSIVSINTAVDASEHINEKLWNDITVKMKRYYSDQLKGLSYGEPGARVSHNEGRAIQCVQGLCSLISPQRAWAMYCSIRSQQLDVSVRTCFVNVPKPKKSMSSIALAAEQFTALVSCVTHMMNDDFELFNSDAFCNVITPLAALSEIYAEPLLREISKITGLLHDDLGNAPLVKSPKRDKKKIARDDKEMSKSPSDVGFLGHLKVGIMKPQSKSADNLLEQDEQAFSDIQVLPMGFLEPITQFIEQLLVLECHIDKLQSAMVWQTTGNSSLTTKSKTNIKGVLKASGPQASDEHSSDAKKQAFSPRSFEKSGILPEAIPPPFGATEAMMAQLSSSLKVSVKPSEDRFNFNWRLSFAKLAPDLGRSIQHHINSRAAISLRELDGHLTNHGQIETVEVSPDLMGGRLDYPVVVAKQIDVLLTGITQVLPLAVAGPDGPFTLTRAGFVDATSVSLKNVIIKLSSLCSDAEIQLPLMCQYTILATMSYVRNHILSYENTLRAEDYGGKKVFPTLYRQYCEAVDELSRLIIENHNSCLMSSLLHDAESHFWDDSKDFFEGERCSFSIQMWYSHLMALQHDLWTTCPPKLSQTMFSAVLQDSLSVLCQRYVRVKPSYRRTAQFRGDITAILVCTSELLYYATSSLAKYLDPTNAHPEHFNIHVNCAMLLAAMVLVTAPIDNIYKVYKKGFKKKRSHGDEESTKGYVAHWLSWIRPEVFPLCKTTPDHLQTTTVLYVLLRLLLTKPETNWSLLLQSLLIKDFTLSIMLLSRIAMTHTEDDSNHSSPEHTTIQANHRHATATRGSTGTATRGSTGTATRGSTGTTTRGSTGSATRGSTGTTTSSSTGISRSMAGRQTSYSSDTKRIFTAFYRILLQCSDFPAALSQVLIPVFERSDSWDVFDVNFPPINNAEQLPPWLSALNDCLEPYIVRTLTPGVKVILTRHHEPVGTEPISLRLKELPCGCSATQDAPLGNKVLSSTTEVVAFVMQNVPEITGNKDVLAEALYSTITQLVMDVCTLPTPIVMFFKAAQKHAAYKGIRSPHNCLGIKIIAVCLKQRLSDLDYIQSLVGAPLEGAVWDHLKMLAECVYHILTASSYGKSSGTPRVAGMFMKANRNWVSDQIDVLLDHFQNKMFDLPENQPLEDATVEFSENLLMSQASIILSHAQGEESFQQVYNLIQNNQKWIFSQLDITPLLGPHQSPTKSHLVLSLEPHKPPSYNPLQAYQTLGDVHFDQTAIMTFPWDWTSLLYSDLGLSQAGFRSLLFNRHEMQDGAYLEENEKRPVESLRRKFHADSPEL